HSFESSRTRQLLDPAVPGVDDVDDPARVGRDPLRGPELPVGAAADTEPAEEGAARVELLDAIVLLVGDPGVARRVGCDPVRERHLAVVEAGAAPLGEERAI